jgi:predicted oxidoreductase
MPLVFTIGFTSGNRPVTQDDLKALEATMSALSDKIAEVTASIEAVKARVATLEANAGTPEDLVALDAAKQSLEGILPVAPPTEVLEPTPTPVP